jgi:hypothetical protein
MKTVKIAAAQTAEFMEDTNAALDCAVDVATHAEAEGASLQPKTAVRFQQFEIASALTSRRLEKFPPRDAASTCIA